MFFPNPPLSVSLQPGPRERRQVENRFGEHLGIQ